MSLEFVDLKTRSRGLARSEDGYLDYEDTFPVEARRQRRHRLGGPRVQIAHERRTFTALNHIARRLARRERQAGVPEDAREMNDRPDWQRNVYMPGRRGRRRIKRSKFGPPRSRKAPGNLPTWQKR